MSAVHPSRVRHLFGIPLGALTLDEACSLVDRAVGTREPLMIGVVNAAKIVNMRRDPELRDSVLSSDLVLADGFSVVLASRLLGRPLPERVAGIDLMHAIMERGSQAGYRLFCLGATEDVLAGAEGEIKAKYPGVRVVGRHHGYFTADEEDQVADEIRQSHADVLLVAMTSPKKERFLARWGATLDVPVCHGVGGSFDVLAGKVRRAPAAWQRSGFEWLYRVIQEPGRLWKRYLVTNTMFILLLLGEMARTATGRTRSA